MSRAFVKEDDGWSFCISRHEACLFAGEDGRCFLGYCKAHGEAKPIPKPLRPRRRVRAFTVAGCRARRPASTPRPGKPRPGRKG